MKKVLPIILVVIVVVIQVLPRFIEYLVLPK